MLSIVDLNFSEGAAWAKRIGYYKDSSISIALSHDGTTKLHGLPQVCLFIAPGESIEEWRDDYGNPEDKAKKLIVAIGILNPGRKATPTDRIHTVSPVIFLESPLPWSEVIDEGNLTASQLESANFGGRARRLPPETGAKIWRSLVNQCTEDDRRNAETIRAEGEHISIGGHAGQVLAQEKDATLTALQIAGLHDQANAFRRVSFEDEDAPFLKRLNSVHQTEDSIINSDARRFSDWLERQVQPNHVSAVEFTGRDGRRLTVINANRTGIESAFGADLVYYNHRCSAFVLVQYKMFRKEGDPIEWVCRPDKLFNSETQKMLEIEKSFSEIAVTDHLSYRFATPATYFKFCKGDAVLDRDTKLMKGIYVPTEYVQPLMSSMKGPKGGVRLEYETAKARAMYVSAFAPLVSSGYIGTRGVTTAQLERVIQARLNGDRSVVLAMSSGR
ncbi:hypothetical protein L612_005200000040 [Rhodococcus rhodochrous J38]|jgi:hypothetical protein|uniref:hypothetical protein n=1 Tax=Rhodococcus rhodochrous TaxID=1829 RepID=UPI00119FEF51|nr:hypothetical protein [Rhodococcus rhodochrous]TWH41270.1 hypothetical protein L612_005200000040 [Rhodococcus rhodochrous J38]